MDIFIINTSKSEFITDELLSQFGYKSFNDKEKEKIHQLAYLMTDRILKYFYEIDDTEIDFINNKPVLKNGKKYFSVSHSGIYIVLGFSDYKCGIDIEQIKMRNYKKISDRFGFDSDSLKTFYIDWTEYEAKYKLGEKSKSVYNFEIPDYIVTAVSENGNENFEIYYNL